MGIFKLINKRRSVRKYLPKKIEEVQIKKIINAARLAPSASNRQPWRFIAVTDKDIIKKIVKDALGFINQWAMTAPLLIIGCTVKGNVVTHYFGEELSKVPYHIIDCSIAMEHAVLSAEELGISTCWIGWFNKSKIKKIVKIPRRWDINAVLAAGYANPEFIPRKRKILPLDKILIIK